MKMRELFEARRVREMREDRRRRMWANFVEACCYVLTAVGILTYAFILAGIAGIF